MWALGVLFFAMLTGKMPFNSGYEAELYRLISQGKFSYPIQLTNQISKDAKLLISQLMQVNPSKRLTA